ncbi:oligosaccharide repeat unit polymerase [Bacillus mesophilus]|uniref:Oligosaccharide repeat unit polymerase n=1 Tax=Bacillus mesophilus TaxID=1808955 RepID=A0A6M0Q7Q8_9BACI|nr:oligosaccharide repeat unit polymerase [Bacillus mesophilus]MBM7661722.1 oligosaccharide repeat unit polymerase [Bacillus mesophilus]NEY72382.1 oligosaccharide repeat unit polymerase [Bacillus mesophilus]
MIIFVVSLILLVFFLTPMIIWRNKGGDLLSPLMISCFFLVLTTVPYLLSISINNDVINHNISRHFQYNELDQIISFYGLVQIIGFIGLLFGLKFRIPNAFISSIPVLKFKESRIRYNTIFLTSGLIGLFGYLIFLNDIGGFYFLINNLQHRAEFTSGNGYTLVLFIFLNISVYTFIYTFKFKKNILKYIILFLLILLVSFTLSTLGGRKPTLQFLVTCVIVWHYGVVRIKKVPLKTFLLVPILLIYIVVIPILRSPDGFENLVNNPTHIYNDVIESTGSVFQQISYVDHYLFITNHFDLKNIWLGRSYVDLLIAPIPSRLYSDKPPVDEGVYLRTLVDGQDVIPSVPFNRLFPSSLPTETLGTMFMNFWIPGVFLGMYILGMIYKISYLYMKRSNFNLFSIIIFGLIILNFQLSNLKIVQTSSYVIAITLVFFVLSKVLNLFGKVR